MMDEYIAEQVLRWYERIERGILEFAEQIPLVPQNEGLEVPILITYLMDACGLLDSLFRDLTSNPVTVDGKTKSRDECDIVDFAKLHARVLGLPETRSVLLVSPPRYRTPFEPWMSLLTGGDYSPLPWWQIYNSLKHDRLSHIHEGTLEATLDAVCALHQVIARRIDMVPMLLRRGWFPLGGYFVDGIIEDAARGQLPDTFIVQTLLFAVPVGREQFPADFSNLNPGLYKCKREFVEFLGRLFR
ncbi:MAG: hypothetical protein ACE5I9_10000 [Candidatus Methylomirabilales bacterium]